MTIKSLYPASRPSLDLNFAKLKRLDPRITFTRASTGSYVGSDGLIKSAAVNEARFDHNPATGESLGLLVEEARTNLALHNNNVGDAIWVEQSTTKIPSALLAPDGTFTATLVKATTANATHKIRQEISTAQSALTFSIYVKAAGYTRIALNEQAQTGSSSAIINLADGSGATSETVVSNAGNGWYRISWSSTFGSGLAKIFCVVVLPNGGSGENPNNFTWTGDGQSGVYIWGANIEAGSFSTSYIPTPATFTSRTSTATYYDSTGTVQTAASGVARSAAFFPDSNGVMRPAGLLLEAAGTNLITYSEQFDNAAWTKTNLTVTANNAVAPDGTTTADTLTATANNADIYNSTPTSNVLHINSIWIKRRTGTGQILLICPQGQTNLDITSQVTNQWKRISSLATLPFAGGILTFAGVRIAVSGDAVDVWGSQSETGSYPTSYIPTVASTVTRSADVSSSATVTRSADVASITGTNFSSWYRQDEGSVLAHSSTQVSSYLAHFYGSSGTQNRIALVRNSSGRGQLVVETNAISQAGITLSGGDSIGVSSKLAAAYKINDFSLAQSSFTGVDTSGTPDPTINKISIGSLTSGASNFANGTISRLTYWPVRLPDATLQALTAS